MIASVIKTDDTNAVLQFDEDDITQIISLDQFPMVEENGVIGIRIGQIFDIDSNNGNIVFCKEETENRRAKVALRLTQLRRK